MNINDCKSLRIAEGEVQSISCRGQILRNFVRKASPVQLFLNGDFRDNSFWVLRRAEFVRLENNTAEIVCTQSQANVNRISNRLCAPVNLTACHRYYICADMKLPRGSSTMIAIAKNDSEYVYDSTLTVEPNTWKRYECVLSPAVGITGKGYSDGIWFGLKGDAPSNSGDKYYVKNAMCIDLTEMYGEGNEPTAEEFRKEYPREYYEYVPIGS